MPGPIARLAEPVTAQLLDVVTARWRWSTNPAVAEVVGGLRERMASMISLGSSVADRFSVGNSMRPTQARRATAHSRDPAALAPGEDCRQGMTCKVASIGNGVREISTGRMCAEIPEARFRYYAP